MTDTTPHVTHRRTRPRASTLQQHWHKYLAVLNAAAVLILGATQSQLPRNPVTIYQEPPATIRADPAYGGYPAPTPTPFALRIAHTPPNCVFRTSGPTNERTASCRIWVTVRIPSP